jgi:hypothetical protein
MAVTRSSSRSTIVKIARGAPHRRIHSVAAVRSLRYQRVASLPFEAFDAAQECPLFTEDEALLLRLRKFAAPAGSVFNRAR